VSSDIFVNWNTNWTKVCTFALTRTETDLEWKLISLAGSLEFHKQKKRVFLPLRHPTTQFFFTRIHPQLSAKFVKLLLSCNGRNPYHCGIAAVLQILPITQEVAKKRSLWMQPMLIVLCISHLVSIPEIIYTIRSCYIRRKKTISRWFGTMEPEPKLIALQKDKMNYWQWRNLNHFLLSEVTNIQWSSKFIHLVNTDNVKSVS